MTVTRYNKKRFAYESVLHTGCLGGRGRFGHVWGGVPPACARSSASDILMPQRRCLPSQR